MSVYQPEIKKPTEDYPRMPLDPEKWTTSAIVVPFFQKYPEQVVIDLVVMNEDTSNPVSIKLNNNDYYNISSGMAMSFNNIIVWKIEITPNSTTGKGTLLPFGIPKDILMR
jgi:hypothetical protein